MRVERALCGLCVPGLLLALGLAGCTTVQKGIAAGAASGGLVGGIIGNNGGEGTLVGAAIGAGAGGILGALIGDGMSDDYSAENENLRNQNAVLQAELDALKNQPAAPAVLKEYTMEEKTLFASGSATLTPEGLRTLADLAEALRRDYPGAPIDVQGHTDNVPIGASGWKSNWELGAARALAVLHYMIDVQGFTPASMSATTFGEYHPASSNDSAEGRRQNRRTVVVVLR